MGKEYPYTFKSWEIAEMYYLRNNFVFSSDTSLDKMLWFYLDPLKFCLQDSYRQLGVPQRITWAYSLFHTYVRIKNSQYNQMGWKTPR